MTGFTNFDQWRREIELYGSVTSETLRAVLPEVGKYAVNAIRRRIPPGASGGNFPGYAARGNLKAAITASRVFGPPSSPRLSVGLGTNVSAHTRMVALVHEYGMTIHARRFKYMTFRVQGHWVRARRVTIRPKAFFSDGWAETYAAFPGIVEAGLRSRWPR